MSDLLRAASCAQPGAQEGDDPEAASSLPGPPPLAAGAFVPMVAWHSPLPFVSNLYECYLGPNDQKRRAAAGEASEQSALQQQRCAAVVPAVFPPNGAGVPMTAVAREAAPVLSFRAALGCLSGIWALRSGRLGTAMQCISASMV